MEYLQSGRDIYEALTASRLPDMIEGLLTDRQIGKLMDYKRQLYDEKQRELNSRFQAAWQDNGDVSTLEPCQEKTCLSRKPKGTFKMGGCWAADQCLCFPYIDSTIPLLPKSKISSL